MDTSSKAKSEEVKRQNSKPILLIEDNHLDAMTAERTLKDLKVTNQMVQMANGEEALEYLRTKRDKKPCLIILDLNMPKMNGLEFLKVAKADNALKKIPVVVLTTSSEQQDIVESFKLGVAGYIVKPIDYKKLVDAIRRIEPCWTLSGLRD